MFLRPDLWNRSIKIAVAVTFVLAVFISFQPPHRRDAARQWFSQQAGHAGSLFQDGAWTSHEEAECMLPPEADNVVVTVKTGASEAAFRIPVQMATSLRCPPNVMLFSDMAQVLGNHKLHDALAKFPSHLKKGNADFDLYRDQIKRKKAGWVDMLPTDDVKNAAWVLDKYKNLHIIRESWLAIPDKKWYINIDADSYLVWSSLLNWLQTFDASKPLYIGSLTCFNEVKAAHGGSGILLSGLASKAVAVDNRTTITKYDSEAHLHCCGDDLVARSMLDNGIPMHNVWPIINGESPFTIPFGPTYWCEPVVTMHHMSVKEMELVGELERRRSNPTTSMNYAELFNDLVFDLIPSSPTDDWDSMPDGVVIPKTPSFEKCMEECESNKECFQLSYDGADCTLGTRSFRHGLAKKPENGKKWQSAWKKGRIAKWAASHMDCKNVHLGFKDAYTCGG